MKLAYFPNQIALNADPVLKSFITGCKSLGIECVPNQLDADAAVIWSMVWMGRMRQNRAVFDHYRNLNKPVFILEVGSLRRSVTWKLSVNHVNSTGVFANTDNFLPNRAQMLNLSLQPENTQRRAEILIASQHQHSEQWQGMPPMDIWVTQTVEQIRKYSIRPIIVRPHPRSSLNLRSVGNITVELPRRIVGSYDNYNLNHEYHCVINWNSGVAIQSAMAGCPVITGDTSLAHAVSGQIQNIEHIVLPDRTAWFEQMLHTEWLIEELALGTPQQRILNKI